MSKIVVSSQNEWYTPIEYIEAAREVMGAIDLDPASCELANKTVKAARYYSKEDNGLMYPWYGRVWLNPPYGKTLMGGGSNLEAFTRYLVNQYEKGNVSQALLLIPTNTATSWFPILWRYPVCFPDFRIRFYSAHGASDGASFGTCFIYLGVYEEKFSEVFSRFGWIVKATTPRKQERPRALELWIA